MNFNDTAIVEYELEKMRNDPKPEFVPNVSRSKFKFRWILWFFAGMVIFRLFGELLRFLF